MKSNIREMTSTQKDNLKKANENRHYEEMEKIRDSRSSRAKRIMKRKPYYMKY